MTTANDVGNEAKRVSQSQRTTLEDKWTVAVVEMNVGDILGWHAKCLDQRCNWEGVGRTKESKALEDAKAHGKKHAEARAAKNDQQTMADLVAALRSVQADIASSALGLTEISISTRRQVYAALAAVDKEQV